MALIPLFLVRFSVFKFISDGIMRQAIGDKFDVLFGEALDKTHERKGPGFMLQKNAEL